LGKEGEKFATLIRFTAKRKQEKLMEAIQLKENAESDEEAIEVWKKLYVKIGREWTKSASVK
jgi:DNA/RNA-binding domain of Phe-tRNA-synthetase-like protein